ncbi:hypothetical protein C8034_v005136 [Colletotrichum sidae]|uniref:Uncharacterized protein n=3 Tax=Colletotrichum orbiculare species complex TaxID=2707354 RepID=A0A4R8QX09_COLTR|nr:hypothetical protein C8035_v005563 [Colletotrichum spinosum]TDZ47200.1 hypothetical protein CTRI78_v008665 [Colletotrichum trifolii]TEA12962.1 hypothetical protein C8034_v005136 [Colletotrichum sidae]
MNLDDEDLLERIVQAILELFEEVSHAKIEFKSDISLGWDFTDDEHTSTASVAGSGLCTWQLVVVVGVLPMAFWSLI